MSDIHEATLFRLQPSSGCWVVVVCPDESPLQGQTPWRHVSQRPQASAGNPSPYQSSLEAWRRGVLHPRDLAVVYAIPPAWCCATQRKHEMEPRIFEGPEPGSHSSAGCHSAETVAIMVSLNSQLPFNAWLSFILKYLQWPECDIHVSINAIWTEHGLMRPSGERQDGLLVLWRRKLAEL